MVVSARQEALQLSSYYEKRNAFDAMVARIGISSLIHRPEILVAVVLWFSELMAKLEP
jgi:hypothetical protein